MTPSSIACRGCGQPGLLPVLSLGETPLANSLLSERDLAAVEPRFTLDLALCTSCSLVQITKSVPPEAMFRSYLYFSSFSDGMLRNAESIVTRLVRERGLGASSLVIEVASNDGYLLQFYKRAGVPVLGIEPAANIAKVAREQKGIDTLCEFFGAEVAERLRTEGKCADVIHGNNVLAHVPDLNGFVRGLATALKDDGIVVIEVPYVKDFVDHCEFDTIYHEHLCYFSLTALDGVFGRNGLSIFDAERIPIHGGSIRIFAGKAGLRERSAAATALLAEEASWGVREFAFYESFSARVRQLRERLRELLARLKKRSKTIAAYGAAAKVATLLNYVGLPAGTLDYVVDRSTHKQGLFMPGVKLPILAPEALLEKQPDYVVILAWNFAEEIMAQQAEYRRRGGKFIVPVPEPRVV